MAIHLKLRKDIFSPLVEKNLKVFVYEVKTSLDN